MLERRTRLSLIPTGTRATIRSWECIPIAVLVVAERGGTTYHPAKRGGHAAATGTLSRVQQPYRLVKGPASVE